MGILNDAMNYTATRFTYEDTKHTATFDHPSGTGTGGEITYYQYGKIVVFSGVVQLTGTLSNGTQIFSNMPAPISTIAVFRVNNSSTGGMYDFYVNAGTVRNGGSCPSGWYRLSGAYLTS